MSKIELINYAKDKQHDLAAFVFRNRHAMDDQTRAMIVQESFFWETLEQILPGMSYANVAIVRNYLGIPANNNASQASAVQLSLF